MPLGLTGTAPRRSLHRDLFLDTLDDALRALGISCRLRIGASTRTLTLRLAEAEYGTTRLDAVVRSADVAGALAEDTKVSRRLQAILDPAALVARADLEVDRLTRVVNTGWLRRPTIAIHLDRVVVRHQGVGRTLHRLCLHGLRAHHETNTLVERLGDALAEEHDLQAAAGDPAEQARLLARWMRTEARREQLRGTDRVHRIPVAPQGPDAAPELNAELSVLAFQRRVLAVAEDRATPLVERLRFLAIVASNVDELYMTRMSGLRRAALAMRDDVRERGDDGLDAVERLAAVEADLATLEEARARCTAECLNEAAREGVQVVEWRSLSFAERAALRELAIEEIHPVLTPLAVTLSPGHPLPHLQHLALSLAVLFRPNGGGTPHLAELEVPADLPPLLEVPGRAGTAITLGAVLRATIDAMYPHAKVESAHLLRVTRGGELELDEDATDDLLNAVAQATARRPLNPAVRVQVERGMPELVSSLLLESLRREATAQGQEMLLVDVERVDGPLDARVLTALPLPARADLEFPPLVARDPVPSGRSMLDVIGEAELLAHHPFDAFDATVVRFLQDAARDPAVTTIKITLYRVGEASPVVDALMFARRMGKRVIALVELKARADESHNVAWARALEDAGASVIYGLVGLKVHAKVALVIRREAGGLRRYVHVGTGNYSARSGRQYTDLSLFSAREPLTADVADLFNELTGSARASLGLAHGALIAPHQLLPALLERIEREAEHARAGRPSGITIKVNGLSEPEVVRALRRAASAGVPIDLVVRGICTLRPDETRPNLRIVSVVGRFLEHSRIYRFANGGAPEHFIGSSDLRPRNLRRRVELLVPVENAEHRARLDAILAAYLADGGRWVLDASGNYTRAADGGAIAQALMSR